MDSVDHISEFANELQAQFTSGYAQEHAYRPALTKLMDTFANAKSTNDPKASEYGRPDILVYDVRNKNIILGRAEAKDITVKLDKVLKTDQLRRYAGYEKLFVTNGLEFRFFQNGEEYQQVLIGKIIDRRIIFDSKAFGQLYNELRAFLELPPEPIKNGRQLALIMGGKASRIRDNVQAYLAHKDNEKNQELEKIYGVMKKLLVHDLTVEKFSDMYAQTLVYGLFVARYNDKTPDDFSRSEARDLVPASNPFLREFFDHIVGPRFDVRLAHIVDELCDVFSLTDVHMLVQKHLRLFQVENDKDPIIHFYEDFLKEYDPIERKRMGAYYTPVPVVRFIVRHVDEILKSEFGITKGLADSSKKTVGTYKASTKNTLHRVQVLDPAVGTATFLNEIIKHIHQDFKGQEGRWLAYVKEDLLPRLYGFELMMAPYTIAHLKLGMTLQETGVTDFSQRLGVYLTNTLEEGSPNQVDLFSHFGLAEVVAEESNKAGVIKHERPVMVIVGNPPYSGVSSNETKYANGLIAKYKVEPGGMQRLQERKHWLNDDYVKFIAFAEDMILKNGDGIVAMITNNGYLDNPTFRGMRWRLRQSFDKIYVLDLHGNAKKKEAASDGGKDENIFDIMQGVGIIVAVKNGGKQEKLADIFHAEIYGKRLHKFNQLDAGLKFTKIDSSPPDHYFVPKDVRGRDDYYRGISMDALFTKSVTGIVTMGDNFIISEDPDAIAERVRVLEDNGYTKDRLNRDFGLGKNYAEFVLANAPRLRFDPSKIVKLNYRPFDDRYTYFDNKVLWRWRREVMGNLIDHKNTAINVVRQFKTGNSYQHVLISDGAIESSYVSGRTSEIGYEFPLYIWHSDGTRTPNFKPGELKKLVADLSTEPSPEDLLDYIYAVLYSPSYRVKYKEFLKIDFPRVPVPTQANFERLVPLGRELRQLHLMQDASLQTLDTTFPEPGSGEVEQVKYEYDKVWINDRQYFGNVPQEAWDLYIGGYQPAQKWLKDRKDRKLTNENIEHYQKIIKVLTRTIRLMQEIDEASVL